jgi:cation:H+ antiporter
MLLTLANLVGGLVLLLLGGHWVVTGASGLARRFGVSPLVVGLTVVAFGTSAPELAVNLVAAFRGEGTLSFGNIVGSNLANIGLILGTAALVRPLVIKSRLIGREVPLMLLATAGLLVMGFDSVFRGGVNVIDRSEGILLLLLFGVFIYWTGWAIRRRQKPDALLEQSVGKSAEAPEGFPGCAACMLRTIAGLAGLAAGGYLTVRGAAVMAELLGVPTEIIGLTVVAVGTSLPELVASVMAAYRGATDLAVGNIVGSNIFNLLFIMGTTATVRPVEVPPRGHYDLVALAVMSLLLVPFALSTLRRIVRWQACGLIVLWVGYSAWRLAG